MSDDKTAKRVAMGADLLDLKMPGWRDRIRVSALDMGACRRCILGQLFGVYVRGVWALRCNGHGYGFLATSAEESKLLPIYWRRQLEYAFDLS